MAFTELEEQDLKKRILDLEAEKTTLIARLDKAADKDALKNDLDLIRKDLKEAREELAALKKPVPRGVSGPGRDDEDHADFLDIVESGGEGSAQ